MLDEEWRVFNQILLVKKHMGGKKEGKKGREQAKETVVRFNEIVREEISSEKLETFFEVIQSINTISQKNNIYEKS